MTTLTVMRGVSGAGKSTRARMIAEMTNAQIVCRDDIRKFMYGSDGSDYYSVAKEVLSEREQRVTVAEQALIENFLRAGIDVVQDNTNVEWKYVKATAKIGYRCNAEVKVEVIDTPLNVAIAWDHARASRGGRGVGKTIITKQYERFKKTKNLILDPVIPPKPYTGTPGKPKAALFDVDGTLAHYRDYRGPFDWNKVHLDDVDEVVAGVARALWMDEYKIIVMSGRDSVCRQLTIDWLNDHEIPWDELFMRPEKDMRPDNLIKMELFDNHVRDNYNVRLVVDDRPSVCRMWREHLGLTVLQVGNPHFEF